MSGRNISTRLGVLITVLSLWVVIPAALAGQIVGRIDAVDPARGVVSIDGVTYQVGSRSSRAVRRGVETQLKQVVPGQVVYYEVEDGKLIGLNVLPGLKEIPH